MTKVIFTPSGWSSVCLSLPALTLHLNSSLCPSGFAFVYVSHIPTTLRFVSVLTHVADKPVNLS